jgi:hypothetical protein
MGAVLVAGPQRIRLELAENAAEVRFDAIHLVEELAALDFELRAAELPVGSQ